MVRPWDSPSTNSRLAAPSGTSTGRPWDAPTDSSSTAPEEDTSVTGRLSNRLEQLTSGKRFIQDTTGYDISKLPGYISTPLDILANPLGIASLLAAIPTGGTSLGATAGARAAGLGTRLALQAGKDLAGGIVGAEAGRIASSALPEDTPEWLKMGVGLAAGVGGGYATGKVISNAIPKGLAGVSEGKVKGAKAKVINDALDPMVLVETIPGVTKTQQAANFVKGATGLGVKANALTTPIIDDIAPGVKQGESLANEYKIKLMADKAGRDDIKYGKYQGKGKADLINIEGEWKPLLKVASQPENYALTESQLDFISPITAELDSWKAAYERQGGKVGRRADLSPGGFYLPRGMPGEDIYPGALPYTKPKRLITTPGAAQHAIWDDVEEALLAGKDYPPLEDAVHDYISGMSKAIVGRSAANKFFALKDSDGVAYFRTAAEMVDPQISGAYKAAESAKYGLDKSIEETAQAVTEAKIRLQEVQKLHAASSITAAAENAGGTLAHPLDDTIEELEKRIEELTNLQGTHTATLDQLNETSALHQLVLDSAKGSYDEAVAGIANDPMVGVIDSGNLATIFAGRNEKVYGPRELTDPINAQLNPNGLLSKTSDVVKSVNAPFRLIHTLFDISDFGRLALQNVLTNPSDFFKGITTGFKSGLGNPAARARDIETINNILTAENIKYTYRDFIKIGKLVVGNPDVDLGLLNALPDSKIINKLKGVSSITQAGIDSIRGHMITTELLNMKRAGITIGDAEVLKAVRAVSLTTGQSIHRAVKGVDTFVQFPNWLQSQFEYIAHAGAGLLPGASYESKYAANSMIRMVGFGIASTMAVNAMGGHKTEFQNGVPMMRVGDMKINAFGPYGALVNGMLAAAKGDATSLVRARVSPLFQVGWDLSTGKTYTGETASFDDPAYWAKVVAPFSLTGGVPGQGPEITLLQGAGVRANPVSTFTKLREQAKETMGTDWADLSGQQREQLRKANPELVAELDKQTKIKAGQGDNYAKTALATQDINANLLQQQESINKLWQEGQISSIQLRKGLDSLSQASSAQKQQVRKDFGTNKGSDTPARVQTALNQYFDLYTLADSGILSGGVKVNITDWDVFDRLEAELMGKLDPVQQKAIQDRYTVKSPALKWYYDNKEVIRNSGYFDATQTVVGRMQGRLKTVVPGAESYSDIQQALNKAQQEGNVAKSYQILSVINGINQQVAPIHQQMTRSNPLLYKALVQNGYVKQSMGRPLASTIQ